MVNRKFDRNLAADRVAKHGRIADTEVFHPSGDHTCLFIYCENRGWVITAAEARDVRQVHGVIAGKANGGWEHVVTGDDQAMDQDDRDWGGSFWPGDASMHVEAVDPRPDAAHDLPWLLHSLWIARGTPHTYGRGRQWCGVCSARWYVVHP
ncbi:MAG: hypothetical protein NVS4B8_03000 [Herpetosiphon sp.]